MNIFSSHNQNINRSNNLIKSDKYLDNLHWVAWNRGEKKYKSHIININSEYRNKNPSITVSEEENLEVDPLEFYNNERKIFIHHPNHNFEINDKITLNGAISKTSTLNTYRDYNLPTFEILEGCNFMKIYYDHNIPLNYNSNTIKIKLEGIKSDKDINGKSTFLGSIPINLINKTHEVKLSLRNDEITCDKEKVIKKKNDKDYFEPNSSYFFILLSMKMTTAYNLQNYNFKLIFESLFGINLNLINASFPIDENHYNGYHIIREITKNGYYIHLDTPAIIKNNISKGGGRGIYVAKIINLDSGYPDANNYKVNLNTIYQNVVASRLISTEIPNTHRLINDYPLEKANNKLYWNNLEDGDHIYSISVPSGNYSILELIDTMNILFSKTERILNNNYNKNKIYHFIKSEINQNTNEIKFKSYKKELIPKYNIKMEYGKHVIIKHKDHNINLFQDIILESSIKELNGSYNIIEIIDGDCYMINLLWDELKCNIEDSSDYSSMNSCLSDIDICISLYIPNAFRFRFDQPDTIGKILGFRNPGNLSSITDYDTVISNRSLYSFEKDLIFQGKNIKINNNSPQLYGNNYMFILIDELQKMSSIGPIKNAFTKILLNDKPNKILYDTFVPIENYYDVPIKELYQLTVSFYTQMGDAVEFNNTDHSFTLEIITEDKIDKLEE